MDKQDKIIRYRQLNPTARKGQIVFAGSSLMEMFPIEQFVAEDNLPVVVYNRGIGGFVTDELLTNLAVCILDLAPRMLFINIGTNDLSDASRPMAQIMGDVPGDSGKSAASASERADLPDGVLSHQRGSRDAGNEAVSARADERKDYAGECGSAEARKIAATCTTIDVNAPLKDEQGRLRAEFTYEGMHIRPEGYRTIYPAIKEILMNA